MSKFSRFPSSYDVFFVDRPSTGPLPRRPLWHLSFRTMVEELASGGEHARSRMSGYPSGRNVLTECMVERFSRSPREWEDAFKNRENRVKMLDDILAVGTPKKVGREDSGQKKIVKADRESEITKVGSSSSQERPVGGNGTGGGKDDVSVGGGVCVPEKGKRRRQRGRGKRGKSSVGQASDMEETSRDGALVATEIDSEDYFNLGAPVLRDNNIGGVGKGVKAAVVFDDDAEVQKESAMGSIKREHQDSREGELSFVPDATTKSEPSEKQSTRIAKDKKAKKRKNPPEVVGGEQREQDSVVVEERRRKSTASVYDSRGKAKEKREENIGSTNSKRVVEVVVEEGHGRSRKRRKSKSSGGGLRLF